VSLAAGPRKQALSHVMRAEVTAAGAERRAKNKFRCAGDTRVYNAGGPDREKVNPTLRASADMAVSCIRIVTYKAHLDRGLPWNKKLLPPHANEVTGDKGGRDYGQAASACESSFTANREESSSVARLRRGGGERRRVPATDVRVVKPGSRIVGARMECRRW